MFGPPDDISPARLFLTLTDKPRPWWPTEVIPGGRVVAMTTRERAAIERAIAGMPTEAAAIARLRYEVAATLHRGDRLLFGSADEAAEEKVATLRSLAAGVGAALRICGPEYRHIDVSRWGAVLLEGARECWPVSYPMGQCEDVSFGWNTARHAERPDRWFGFPLSDMTDGQWMGYRAAVAYVYERREAQANR